MLPIKRKYLKNNRRSLNMSLKNKNKESIEENELIKEVKQKLKEIIQLEDNLKKNKNEDIKQMIKYYRDMTIEIEDRRTRLNSVNLQLNKIWDFSSLRKIVPLVIIIIVIIIFFSTDINYFF